MPRPRTHDAGTERLLEFFEAHRGAEIELPSILRLGIAQYNRAIKDLRSRGYLIENRIEWRGRRKFSWYRFRGLAQPGALE